MLPPYRVVDMQEVRVMKVKRGRHERRLISLAAFIMGTGVGVALTAVLLRFI